MSDCLTTTFSTDVLLYLLSFLTPKELSLCDQISNKWYNLRPSGNQYLYRILAEQTWHDLHRIPHIYKDKRIYVHESQASMVQFQQLLRYTTEWPLGWDITKMNTEGLEHSIIVENNLDSTQTFWRFECAKEAIKRHLAAAEILSAGESKEKPQNDVQADEITDVQVDTDLDEGKVDDSFQSEGEQNDMQQGNEIAAANTRSHDFDRVVDDENGNYSNNIDDDDNVEVEANRVGDLDDNDDDDDDDYVLVDDDDDNGNDDDDDDDDRLVEDDDEEVKEYDKSTGTSDPETEEDSVPQVAPKLTAEQLRQELIRVLQDQNRSLQVATGIANQYVTQMIERESYRHNRATIERNEKLDQLKSARVAYCGLQLSNNDNYNVSQSARCTRIVYAGETLGGDRAVIFNRPFPTRLIRQSTPFLIIETIAYENKTCKRKQEEMKQHQVYKRKCIDLETAANSRSSDFADSEPTDDMPPLLEMEYMNTCRLSFIAYFEVFIEKPRQVRTERNRAVELQERNEWTVGTRSECVSVGMCNENFKLVRFQPGWDKNSFGYHGDDGRLFHGTGMGGRQIQFPVFGCGDVVGCGLNYLSGRVFYTKNGVFLGYVRHWGRLSGSWYGCVGLDSFSEVRVSMNGPFIFDLVNFEKDVMAEKLKMMK